MAEIPATQVVIDDAVWNLVPGEYHFDGKSFTIPMKLRRRAPRQWVIGVYAGDLLPEDCVVVRMLSAETHPEYGSTNTRRYYVFLVEEDSDV